MRRFTLLRTVDLSGVSGTGAVADGVQFADGRVVLCWTGRYRSLGVYASIEELVAIHGHGGCTVVAWIDGAQDPD